MAGYVKHLCCIFCLYMYITQCHYNKFNYLPTCNDTIHSVSIMKLCIFSKKLVASKLGGII